MPHLPNGKKNGKCGKNLSMSTSLLWDVNRMVEIHIIKIWVCDPDAYVTNNHANFILDTSIYDTVFRMSNFSNLWDQLTTVYPKVYILSLNRRSFYKVLQTGTDSSVKWWRLYFCTFKSFTWCWEIHWCPSVLQWKSLQFCRSWMCAFCLYFFKITLSSFLICSL